MVYALYAICIHIYIYVKCMYNGIYVFIMICVYIMVYIYIYIHDDLCTFQDRRMFMTQASTAYNATFYILHI